MSLKKYLLGAASSAALLGAFIAPAFADVLSPIDFEPAAYSVGNINGQNGWSKTGPFDVEVENVAEYPNAATFGFGTQALRISNAITSGSFGDQTFSPGLASPANETSPTRFEASFQIGSTQAVQQPGLFLSVSPDDGNGSRMSYAGFDDQEDGIHVIFYDVTNAGLLGTVADFNFNDVATITRNSAHTIKFEIDLVAGPANDVVKLYVDNVLEHTGTTWEDYYRYDPEQLGNGNVVPSISKLLFRVGGGAAAGTSENGYLVDGVSLESEVPTMPTTPVITSPANGAVVTVSNMVEVDWTDSTGTFTPFEYQYQAFSDAAYTANLYTSGWLTDSKIPTPGTPPGDYYVRVMARDSAGNLSDWSNDAGTLYKITVIADPVTPVTPANMDACKKNGWTTFLSLLFKNQGECVSYVQSNGNAGKR